MKIEYLHILIMLTITVSIIFSPKKIVKEYAGLQILIILNLFAELLANYLWSQEINNTPIYNFVILYNFIIWIYLFSKKTIVPIGLFLIIYCIDLLFLHGAYQFASYSYLLGTYLVCYYILYFFYNNFILNQNDLQINYPSLVAKLAALLYHVGFATLLFINNWGATEFYVFGTISVYQAIGIIINSLFYGVLIFYFYTFSKYLKLT